MRLPQWRRATPQPASLTAATVQSGATHEADDSEPCRADDTMNSDGVAVKRGGGAVYDKAMVESMS